MALFVCRVCGYEYDEGEEDTEFYDLPDDWTCPLCGASKEDFTLLRDDEKEEEESYF